MSQNPTPDWPAWITASVAVLGVIAIPAGAWIMKLVLGSIARAEFAQFIKNHEQYLERRDQLSADRHQENLDNFRDVTGAINDLGQRVSHVEGAMSGSYRRPT